MTTLAVAKALVIVGDALLALLCLLGMFLSAVMVARGHGLAREAARDGDHAMAGAIAHFVMLNAFALIGFAGLLLTRIP